MWADLCFRKSQVNWDEFQLCFMFYSFSYLQYEFSVLIMAWRQIIFSFFYKTYEYIVSKTISFLNVKKKTLIPNKFLFPMKTDL